MLHLWLVVTLSVARCHALVVAEVGVGVVCALVVAGRRPRIEENTSYLQELTCVIWAIQTGQKLSLQNC